LHSELFSLRLPHKAVFCCFFSQGNSTFHSKTGYPQTWKTRESQGILPVWKNHKIFEKKVPNNKEIFAKLFSLF